MVFTDIQLVLFESRYPTDPLCGVTDIDTIRKRQRFIKD